MEGKSLDTLISRILVGKPDLSPDVLRRIVPGLDEFDDHALMQKIAWHRRRIGLSPDSRDVRLRLLPRGF